MTRPEFIARFKHEYLGLILDALFEQRRGAECSLYLAAAQQRAVAALGAMYDALQPADPVRPAANGTHKPDPQPARKA